jgi:hypothetical protein
MVTERLAGCVVMVGAVVASFCAIVPHPATSVNNVKNEPAKVFFTICIAFPFRSRTGHPLKPACVVARYGEGGIRCGWRIRVGRAGYYRSEEQNEVSGSVRRDLDIACPNGQGDRRGQACRLFFCDRGKVGADIEKLRSQSSSIENDTQ